MSRNLLIFPLLTITMLASVDCRTRSETTRRTQNKTCAEVGQLPAPVDVPKWDDLTSDKYDAILAAGIGLLQHGKRSMKCIDALYKDLVGTADREQCLREQLRYYESSPMPGSLLVGIRCKK